MRYFSLRVSCLLSSYFSAPARSDAICAPALAGTGQNGTAFIAISGLGHFKAGATARDRRGRPPRRRFREGTGCARASCAGHGRRFGEKRVHAGDGAGSLGGSSGLDGSLRTRRARRRAAGLRRGRDDFLG